MKKLHIKTPLLLLLILWIYPSIALAVTEQRCGWFDNPNPHVAWLADKDSDWFVSVYDGEVVEKAEGQWPVFKTEQWIATNGNSGYGCACITGLFDHKTHKLQKIVKSIGKPLSACRSDPHLTEPEY